MGIRSIITSPLLRLLGGSAGATVSGNPAVGQVLSAVASGLASPTYQWMRDGVAISGATGATYGVQSPDRGHTLACAVTGTVVSSGVAVAAAVTPAVPANALLFSGQPLLFGGQNLLY